MVDFVQWRDPVSRGSQSLMFPSMNALVNGTWNVLCWNVRGVNASRKWDSIRNKVIEANCDIVCFQEKKRILIRFSTGEFCLNFDAFLFVPSVGATGGLMVAWKSSRFDGLVKLQMVMLWQFTLYQGIMRIVGLSSM